MAQNVKFVTKNLGILVIRYAIYSVIKMSRIALFIRRNCDKRKYTVGHRWFIVIFLLFRYCYCCYNLCYVVANTKVNAIVDGYSYRYCCCCYTTPDLRMSDKQILRDVLTDHILALRSTNPAWKDFIIQWKILYEWLSTVFWQYLMQ